MTPEQEAELFTTLGRMEAKMDSFNATLTAHTLNDSANFEKMETDLNTLLLNKAKAEGVAEEAAKHASSVGATWGGFTGGFVSIVIAAVAAYFGK